MLLKKYRFLFLLLAVLSTNLCLAQQSYTDSGPLNTSCGLMGLVDVQHPDCFDYTNGRIEVLVSSEVNTSFNWLNLPSGTNLTNIADNLPAGSYSLQTIDQVNCFDTLVFTLTAPEELLVMPNNTILCSYENSVELISQVVGGTGSYTYSWTSTNGGSCFSCAGSITSITESSVYNVTVSDGNNCQTSEVVNIIVLDSLELSLNTTPETCGNDGVIDVIALGGAGGYSYSLNNADSQATGLFPNLSPGSYQIEVTDSEGCITIENVLVSSQLITLNYSLDINEATCYGDDDASIEVLSSSSDINSYELDNNGAQNSPLFENLSPGEYIVSIYLDNGCSELDTITIAETDSIFIDSIQVNPPSCPEGTNADIIVIVSGGYYEYSLDGIIYDPNNTFEDLPADIYTVYVQDSNGCVATETITIQDPTPPTITIQQSNVTCPEGTDADIIVIVSGGYYEYSLDGIIYDPNNTFENLGAGEYTVYIQDSNACVYTEILTITEPNPPTITIQQNNVSCPGADDAYIIVIVSGGVYDYSLDGNVYGPDNTFNNLSPGDYTVYVQDSNACVFTEMLTITEPISPTFTIEQTNPTCPGANDGSILIQAGTGFEYSLDNVNFSATNLFENLAADLYTVYILDISTQCIYDEMLSITAPSNLNYSINSTDNNCPNSNDGSIEIITIPGSQYSYSIDGITFQSGNIFNDLSGGIYIVYIEYDSFCLLTDTLEIMNPVSPEITIFSEDVSCYGEENGSINISVNGPSNPFLYSIDNGINYQVDSSFLNLMPDNYLLHVLDANNCLDTISAEINQPDSLAITETITDNNGLSNIDLEVSGGVPPYTYSWSNGADSQDLFDLLPDSYHVTVFDSHNCMQTASYLIEALSLHLIENNAFSVYPNPANDYLEINSNNNRQIEKVELISIQGKLLFFKNGLNENTEIIRLNNINPGLYFLKIKSANEEQIIKLIIEH